jgi:hypothetical protein
MVSRAEFCARRALLSLALNLQLCRNPRANEIRYIKREIWPLYQVKRAGISIPSFTYRRPPTMRPISILLLILLAIGIIIFIAGIGVISSGGYGNYNPATVGGLFATGTILVVAAFLGFCLPKIVGSGKKGGVGTGGPHLVNNAYVDNSGFWPGVTAQNNADYNAWQANNYMQTINSINNPV